MKNSLEEAIDRHPFFHGVKPQFLAIAHKGAKIVDYQPGEVLFLEGEPANRLFLIVEGEVVLEAHEPADGSIVVQTIHEGQVVGWSWLFPPFRWHLRAHAVEPTQAIVLDAAHLLAAAEAHHDFGYELMKRVAQVVIQRVESTCCRLLTRERGHAFAK